MDTVHRTLIGIAVALSASLAGCGSETATTTAGADPSGEAPSSGVPSFAEPKGLTCPTDERVGTEGGSFAEWPAGAETPEEVVDAKSTPTEPWVLVGKRAYVLRSDGTAYEVHDVVKGPKGWFLHGYEACG